MDKKQHPAVFGKAWLALFVLSVCFLPLASGMQHDRRCCPLNDASAVSSHADGCCDTGCCSSEPQAKTMSCCSRADADAGDRTPGEHPTPKNPLSPDSPADQPCPCPNCGTDFAPPAPVIAPVATGVLMDTRPLSTTLPALSERPESAALAVAVQPPIA